MAGFSWSDRISTDEVTNMLELIKTPEDLKKLPLDSLPPLAEEIRSFMIASISRTGGHIGANLGVIELTMALHYVFQQTRDSILYDVGHQGYTHKLLTGRMEQFATLNTFGGMSRFITPSESSYDILDASHAGTAISIGSGLALAAAQSGEDRCIVSVVGDGSLVEGMSFEGLNFAVDRPLPFVLVINDNGMSIPQNVGGIRNLFLGNDWEQKSRGFFTGLGFSYLAVPDGHDLPLLIEQFTRGRAVATSNGPVVVHVKTEKGRGLALAKDHPYKMHFSMPFDPETGAGASPVPAGRLFTAVVGETLDELVGASPDTFALTPSTPYASGLDPLLKKYPGNVLDVGMAEQHAVGMAAGLAMAGKKVFACLQSTFMQRAMDQLFHDVCFPGLPVTVIAARSGFSGFDSPTHHGIYDLVYLQAIPNLQVFYAGTSRDLRAIMKERAREATEPMVVLHPYEGVWSGEEGLPPAAGLSEPELLAEGKDGAILAVGNRIPEAFELRRLLKEHHRLDFAVVNARWIKPLPEQALCRILGKVPRVVTLEEGPRRGGYGAAVALLLAERLPQTELFVSGLEDGYLPAGDKQTLSQLGGIDAASILAKLENKWGLK
jgi:1-deoxy-D-xylulose-5-phosphate synthase